MYSFGLLGHPLGHSLSPVIHEKLMKLIGIEGRYGLYDVPPEQLPVKMGEILSLDGANVTIPYKGDVIPYLDELDDTAKRYMSVNCIAVRDGKKTGFNTDCVGFIRSLEGAGGRLDGRVLLCGCGGVGRMIGIECLRHGARLTVKVRPGRECTVDGVAAYARENCLNEVRVVTADTGEEYDTLINGTSVGMFPNVGYSPADEDTVRRAGFVYDVIYNPSETLIMRYARKNGIPCTGGMAMLVYQAAAAEEYWTGMKFDDEDVEKIVDEMMEMI